MITKEDLQEAIAECQGVRNPDANTCIKLASYYTILREMYGEKEQPTYSYSSSNNNFDKISYYSDTDFGRAIEGKDADYVWDVIDEAMSTIQVINPNLYNGIMRKLDF